MMTEKRFKELKGGFTTILSTKKYGVERTEEAEEFLKYLEDIVPNNIKEDTMTVLERAYADVYRYATNNALYGGEINALSCYEGVDWEKILKDLRSSQEENKSIPR